MSNFIYTVIAYRNGDKESEHYVLGCWSTYETALHEAKLEQDATGRQYECQILKVEVDVPIKFGVKNITIVKELEEYI